jgi:predicted dehydrogenase
VTVDDNVAAIIEWPNLILGTIRANWCSPSARIYGTEGMVFINFASKTNPVVVFSPQRPAPRPRSSTMERPTVIGLLLRRRTKIKRSYDGSRGR